MNNSKCLKVDIDCEFHKKIKTISASFGLSLKDVTVEALSLWVNIKSRELGLKP